MQVTKENCFNTTHPQYTKYLRDIADGYTHTYGSNKKVLWKCPDCNYEYRLSFNKFIARAYKCSNCNDHVSYGEKFVCNLLDQLNLSYEREKIFSWSDEKRFDFYVPSEKIIIEVNGKQHYATCFSSQTVEERQTIDMDKMIAAVLQGFTENTYIYLPYLKTCDMEYMKQTILNSPLAKTYDLSQINWKLCDSFALTNNSIKEICNIYENETHDLNEILKKTHYTSLTTIKNKLKAGYKMGWCSYTPEQGKELGNQKVRQRVLNELSKEVIQMTLDDHVIHCFPSIQEAQRQLNISHIWDCCIGRRKSAGGYKWKYKEG
jgi:hypothetical protein